MNEEKQVLKALHVIEKASAPMTIGELMKRARVRQAAAATALGRLTDRGLLQMEAEWASVEWGAKRCKESMVIRYSVKKGEDGHAA